MSDMTAIEGDSPVLFQIAMGQQGYFTAQQAREEGYQSNYLDHHLRNGRLTRTHRGVYRFRDYPWSPHEHVMAAWLALGKHRSVVSHESALDLFDLTDVLPHTVDLTVPRSVRNLPKIAGATIHTTVHPFEAGDTHTIEGIEVTSPTRTIMDTAAHGTSPEHIEVAVRQALERGITTRRRLREAASTRNKRVQDVIEQAIDVATT